MDPIHPSRRNSNHHHLEIQSSKHEKIKQVLKTLFEQVKQEFKKVFSEIWRYALIASGSFGAGFGLATLGFIPVAIMGAGPTVTIVALAAIGVFVAAATAIFTGAALYCIAKGVAEGIINTQRSFEILV